MMKGSNHHNDIIDSSKKEAQVSKKVNPKVY